MNGVSRQIRISVYRADKSSEPTAYHEDMRREMIKEMAEFGKYRQFLPCEDEIHADVCRRNPCSWPHEIRCDRFQSYSAGLAFSRPSRMGQQPRQLDVPL